MDVKETSAMTEASGPVDDPDGRTAAERPDGIGWDPTVAAPAFDRGGTALGRAAAQRDGAGPIVLALRRVPTRHLDRARALGPGRRAADVHGTSRHFRTGDRGAIDESGARGLGRWQQSFPIGCPKETEDPHVLAATMSQLGVVLKRAAGSANEKPKDRGRLREAAETPRSRAPAGRRRPRKGSRTARETIGKAKAALDKAECEHANRAAATQAEIEALEKRSRVEESRWEKEESLQAVLRKVLSSRRRDNASAEFTVHYLPLLLDSEQIYDSMSSLDSWKKTVR